MVGSLQKSLSFLTEKHGQNQVFSYLIAEKKNSSLRLNFHMNHNVKTAAIILQRSTL